MGMCPFQMQLTYSTDEKVLLSRSKLSNSIDTRSQSMLVDQSCIESNWL